MEGNIKAKDHDWPLAQSVESDYADNVILVFVKYFFFLFDQAVFNLG